MSAARRSRSPSSSASSRPRTAARSATSSLGHAEVDRQPRQAVRRLERGALMAPVLAARRGWSPRAATPGDSTRRRRDTTVPGRPRVAAARSASHRFPLVVAARVVMREERGVLEAALGRIGLEQRADALVQLAALLQQQSLVGDLLRQALAEAELVARQRRLAMHQAAPLELRQLALDVDAVVREQRARAAACGTGGRARRPPARRAWRSGPSASRRAAMTSWTVPGMGRSASGRVSAISPVPVRTRCPSSMQRADDLLGEERAALGLRDTMTRSSSRGSGPPRPPGSPPTTSSSDSGRSATWVSAVRHAATARSTPGRWVTTMSTGASSETPHQLVEHARATARRSSAGPRGS